METIIPFAVGSIKALLLLVVASGAALALNRRPARLRAVVWSIALAGSLAIPLIAPLLPTWSVPMPAALARFMIPKVPVQKPLRTNVSSFISQHQLTPVNISQHASTHLTVRNTPVPWQNWVLAIWILGASALIIRLGFGLWRVSVAVRRAHPVTDPHWLRHLDRALAQVPCRRTVRLLVSDRIEIPATVGLFRPAVLLPLRADTWLDDRRRAVLLHELVHVARFDWPARMVARVARAIYWFNPLAWWAVRRLDLEQELACDEEVLAFGTGASDYACHLLGIARHARPAPAPAIPALGMARTTHLEERIMTILKKTTHRRVGIAVIIPAAMFMAAMVPALASVYPGDPTPRPASTELKEVLAEMDEAEKNIEPHLKQLESIEVQMEPKIEMLENIDVQIDDAKIAEIEARMQPYLDQLEDIEIDMKPYEQQLEALEDQFRNMELHIEDGKLEDIERQIHEQMAAHMGQIETIQVDLEPFLKQMEAIHQEMSGLYEELAEVHIDMEPIHTQMEKIHVDLEPFHEQMEKIHAELEPFHREMEILGDRLEKAIQAEVVSYLRSELGAVTSPGAPFDEAAARIIDDANINVHDKVLKINGDDTEIREILTDLMLPHRLGTQESFDRAIDNAATGLSPMVIQVD
jgi:beta-lactamase regulating signal transducer with metallopeptidase domain/predicted  nucleic acid-binding Zn-ribbon protein